MANVDQKNLIPLCILEVLRKYSDPEHPLTHNMIADHLEADYNISPRPERKSIGRNLENLRSQMELDIEITPKGSYMVSRDFEDYEIRLLIDTVLSNRYISSIETRELVSKLKGLSGVFFESYEDNLLTIDEKSKTDKRDLYFKLQMINDAINRGCDLHFELAEDADVPMWMVTQSFINDQLSNKTQDDDTDDDIDDRSAQITPEYLVLMNQRYYVAFKTIVFDFPSDYIEELAYCGVDEMNDLHFTEHVPVVLPYGEKLAGKVEISEEAVRDMVSRGRLERLGAGKMRVDFLIEPPLLKKAKEAFGDDMMIMEYKDFLFPHLRIIVDADKGTFEKFWWDNLMEVRLLGPAFEVTWLKSQLKMAEESMEDAELLKQVLGIDNVIIDKG